jgi:hypothetical protein
MNTDAPSRREIREVALLDLTGANAEQALAGVTRIADVAAILVSESLLAKLSSIPMEHVAATVPVPDGSHPRVFTGQVLLSGEALAIPENDPSDILVVTGQLVITSPVERVGYKQLIVMGQILAPVGSETALGAGLTRISGQLIYYPYTPGANLRVQTGSVRLTAADLANPHGQPTDILLCVGQLVISGSVDTIGYRHVLTVGQVIAPRGTENVLAGRVLPLLGETVYYDAPPRVFNGKDVFYGAFFELLDEPITLVLDGRFVFDDDVSPDVLKQKVAAIVLDGRIVAPRRLVPLLQVLTIARNGSITASDAVE